MPFTLSHAAAVLPVIRRTGRARGPLVASALVAGSFAPDLTYFADSVLPGAMAFGEVTHSPLGVLTVDVLLGALLAGLWLVLRDPLVGLVPPAWRGRVYGLVRGRPWRGRPVLPQALWFWVSAALGATTHVVWDAFTHADRWGVRLLPVLGEMTAGFPLYYYAQYGGSALALAGTAAFLVSAVRRSPDAALPVSVPRPGASGRLIVVVLLALCASAGAVHRCLRMNAATGWDYNLVNYTPTAMFGAGAGLAAGLVVYTVTVRARRWWGPAGEPRRTGGADGPREAAAVPAGRAGGGTSDGGTAGRTERGRPR
ncbi:DUF4184 family protein [Streptomyces xinghaiensis]|uniref:DUF4184 family protein n=1 Tax=Streptomyces xinghaiensis TaxID=1038928 RepID=UPI002E0EDEF1|nr:DUF4184 family protein [Streptomyces xinghaiensis]